MVLTTQEESLISVVRSLPPEEAGRVFAWARQLADVAAERVIHWSDEWSDEDLSDATIASLCRIEDEEQASC